MVLFFEVLGMGESSFPSSPCPALNFYHAAAILGWPRNDKLSVFGVIKDVIKFSSERLSFCPCQCLEAGYVFNTNKMQNIRIDQNKHQTQMACSCSAANKVGLCWNTEYYPKSIWLMILSRFLSLKMLVLQSRDVRIFLIILQLLQKIIVSDLHTCMKIDTFISC